MIFLILLLSAAPQSDRTVCSGTEDVRDCRSDDGTTYVERRLVDQVVRQGTSPDGSSWTEYLTRVYDGTRLEGSDTNGRRWSQQCNPRFGTTGTDRSGKSIYIPPVPRRAAEPPSADRFGPVSNPIGNEVVPNDACDG